MFNQRLRERFQGARVYPHRRLSAFICGFKKTNDRVAQGMFKKYLPLDRTTQKNRFLQAA